MKLKKQYFLLTSYTRRELGQIIDRPQMLLVIEYEEKNNGKFYHYVSHSKNIITKIYEPIKQEFLNHYKNEVDIEIDRLCTFEEKRKKLLTRINKNKYKILPISKEDYFLHAL